MELDFQIDKLTRSIENVATGDSFPTEVLPLTKPDLLQITKKNGWKFNWKAEFNLPDREIFKLVVLGNPTIIQGLVSLIIGQKHVEMPLIEASPLNFGKNKIYFGVPGNLVAYACKLSFEYGFEGYVAFVAKTKLMEHYEKTLGAVRIGNQRMIIRKEQSEFLVKKYFKNFKLD